MGRLNSKLIYPIDSSETICWVSTLVRYMLSKEAKLVTIKVKLSLDIKLESITPPTGSVVLTLNPVRGIPE